MQYIHKDMFMLIQVQGSRRSGLRILPTRPTSAASAQRLRHGAAQ
jgi:hypothetical protein